MLKARFRHVRRADSAGNSANSANSANRGSRRSERRGIAMFPACLLGLPFALPLALAFSGVAQAAIHAPSCQSSFRQAFGTTLSPSADPSDLHRLFGDFRAVGDRSTRIGVGIDEPLDGFLFEFLRGIDPLFDREGDPEAVEVQTESGS